MSSVSKIVVVVVVVHGQSCVVNENCLYKAILKRQGASKDVFLPFPLYRIFSIKGVIEDKVLKMQNQNKSNVCALEHDSFV